MIGKSNTPKTYHNAKADLDIKIDVRREFQVS